MSSSVFFGQTKGQCHTGCLHLKGKQTSLTTWGFLSTPISESGSTESENVTILLWILIKSISKISINKISANLVVYRSFGRVV